MKTLNIALTEEQAQVVKCALRGLATRIENDDPSSHTLNSSDLSYMTGMLRYIATYIEHKQRDSK